ncbi:MAG TPA: dUTP diphosphatase [Candidatus Paenibacillus intestinavium]|nr:dUTP diphosphatase [Candidatus Paenibacillus intestinavium]
MIKQLRNLGGISLFQVLFKRLEGNEDLLIPKRMTEGSAGFDLQAAVAEPIVLAPGERQLIPTGFAMAMPIELEAQIRPRSGLAYKHGITCLNSPGTIDADYRGEVKVLLINHGQAPFIIERGERIAQMLFQVVPNVTIVEADELPDTLRGAGGFGHTGV